MAAYKLEVIRYGYIIVDDVEDIAQAEEYIENCNPVDDVEWSSFLETTACGNELQIIYVPEMVTANDLAKRLNVSKGEIIEWLSILNKELLKMENPVITFEFMEKIGNWYNVLFKRIEKVTYYEDYRLKVVEEDGSYNVYDKKYGDRIIRKNKSKEWIDTYIQNVINKRRRVNGNKRI